MLNIVVLKENVWLCLGHDIPPENDTLLTKLNLVYQAGLLYTGLQRASVSPSENYSIQFTAILHFVSNVNMEFVFALIRSQFCMLRNPS